MDPTENDVDKLVDIRTKYVSRTSQLDLLQLVVADRNLCATKIVSSVNPKIGKVFSYQDLEKTKSLILFSARQQLLELSVAEAQRDISKLKEELSRSEEVVLTSSSNINIDKLSSIIKQKVNPVIRKINKKISKKVSFFSTGNIVPPQQKLLEGKRRKRKSAKQRKRLNHRTRQNRKKRKAEALKIRVTEIIDKKLVINLSSKQIPEQCYLYLAKGLNYVESAAADKEDLLFDTQSFIRKLEWKAYFKQYPESNPVIEDEVKDMHDHMRVTGSSHPDYSHPLLDQIKTRLLGWIANTNLSTPASNLGNHEVRGRKLLLELINEEKVFITKADKGGATLILDYNTVVNLIYAEVSDECKYTKLESTIEVSMESTRSDIIKEVLRHEDLCNIKTKDKTMITGLNAQNNMKHNPAYRAVPPKIWPLFKIHKLNEEQLENKVIPPQRFINAAKFGPLYRLGQWSSPHLTNISRVYCKEEFLLDTADLLNQIEEYNRSPLDGNVFLATLDVEALYPSIDPKLALIAMKDAFESDDTTAEGVKEALLSFTELSFKHSYVTFREYCYKSKKGIPTGGCDSRQIADMFLHWLIYKNLKEELPWDSLTLFKRFIDDCFLIWKGTLRQFSLFVEKLNKAASRFGIRFGSWEIGKEVNFLDVTLYLDSDNKIQYKLFTKPTDARNYLRTDSFHPKHVFSSVAYSQMLRVAHRNSKDGTRLADLSQLKTDLCRSGHDPVKLDHMEPKALNQASSSSEVVVDPSRVTPKNTMVFPIQYFAEMPEFKSMLKDIKPDIQALLGPTDIVVASKKGRSIGNRVLRNSAICRTPVDTSSERSQSCGAPRCKTCKHMGNAGDEFIVNDHKLVVPSRFDCKTRNCVYIAQCKQCDHIVEDSYHVVTENTYIGQTMQKFHERVNGHRSCFNNEGYKKSALSLHAFDHHRDDFSLDNYKFAIVKECNPRQLNREEFRFIEKFKTNCLGLNRCKVER